MVYRDANGKKITDRKFVDEIISIYKTLHQEVLLLDFEHPDDVVHGLVFTKSRPSLVTPSVKNSGTGPVSFFIFEVIKPTAEQFAGLLTEKKEVSYAAENYLFFFLHYALLCIRATAKDRESASHAELVAKRNEAASLFSGALQHYMK